MDRLATNLNIKFNWEYTVSYLFVLFLDSYLADSLILLFKFVSQNNYTMSS
jgi:hypothetical protein